MKRLTFFDATLSQGGAERVISIITKELAARENLKIEILLWYDFPPFYDIDPRVELHFISNKAKSSNFIKKILWLHKHIKYHTDILISFLAPINMIAIVAHWFTGKPVIVADRNDPSKVPVNPVLRKIRDILYMFADGVVIQTQKNKQYFSKTVQNKSEVIYNPIDLKEYTGIALETDKIKKIVSVGRLMPQKNQKMLLKAFANVLEQYPEYKLEIYGDESEYKSELDALIEELGIGENVLLAGSVADLHDRIKSAELFVLSSNYEGMPNALIEAMCLGLPVISTRVSGATDLIQQGENGLLVEVGNCKELESAILKVLGDKEFAENMAQNAVKLNKELEVSQIVHQWIMFIENYI